MASQPVEYFVGLMSGTSLDGVDAVLVGFAAGRIDCLAAHRIAFDDAIRREALALHAAGHDEMHRAAMLANRLARVYAEAVAALKVSHGETPVRAIGCHGQTIRHAPELGYTLQLNNPALLAELTGIDVIADFRGRDIAAGGQGAPLVPAFHDAMFRVASRHRVILNIGGIANLTNLAPGKTTTGFDCGPGNMLLDAWAERHLGCPFDEDGRWSRQGSAIPALLDRFRQHPFLTLMPPKSCGREQFNIDWLQSQLSGDEKPVDVQATLVAFSASTIADAVRNHCGRPEELYVCGGGARNSALMTTLSDLLPKCRTATTDFLGLPADQVEATAFAWLAWRTVHRRPGNLPAVTGARGPRILGAIYPA